MYKGRQVCVVVPAHNEESQIGKVITTMPEYIDKIVIVDDFSIDKTVKTVKQYQKDYDSIELIEHSFNQGVGGAIASGYQWAKENNLDIAVVMAGDGQMDPTKLTDLLEPIVNDEVDYTKNNRLSSGEAYKKIPTMRYLGNSILSLLTKIISGYWHISDSQAGYTAINKIALHAIDWSKMYKRYGQPNDLLVRLNVHSFRVKDVPMEPVYNVGEKSGIRIHKVIFTIGFLLFKLFFWRLKEKYYIRDCHPLVFFYMFAFLLVFLSGIFFIKVICTWFMYGHAAEISLLSFMFLFFTGMHLLCFAMWLDADLNKNLRG